MGLSVEKEQLLPDSTEIAAKTQRSCAKKVAVGLLLVAGLLATFGTLSELPVPECMLNHSPVSSTAMSNTTTAGGSLDAGSIFLGLTSTERLRENLAKYTSKTRVGGKNKEFAEYTRDCFLQLGLDTQISEYYPWLNYPVDQRVALFNATTSEVLFEAGLKEDVIPGDPASSDPNNLPAFHGYSADGNVTGQLVYANYGSVDDFKALKAAGISVKDKIVLVRYGNLFRGLKVHGAELEGARGVLIYSDPAEDGYVQGPVYPEGPWRPESSFQRGSVQRMTVYPGDPLTPGYAATEDAPRLDPSKATNINHIPSLPLSHRDAEPLLRALKGQGKQASEVGDNWVGGLTSKGVEYWTGPSELNVNLLNKVEYKTMPIQNVIGKIRGSEEPNRAIIIGNHFDSWSAGAADPASGSAALLEIAYGLGQLLKLGWRPRRTIILASWDAEEYFTVGSTEWVEDNLDWLRAEAVAYLNVDMAVAGHDFTASASPILKDILYDVTKKVHHPNSTESVYSMWAKKLLGKGSVEEVPSFGKKLRVKKPRPPVHPLGSGSDYTAFMAHAGISSIDMRFSGQESTYHSNYDNFNWMVQNVDPDMKYHEAITQIWGLMAIQLATDPVLDLNPVAYAKEIKQYVVQIEKMLASKLHKSNKYKHKDMDAVVAKKLRHVRKAQQLLLTNARAIEQDKKRLLRVYGENCEMGSKRRQAICVHLRKQINDCTMRLERQFLNPEGIPGREWYKHILASPGRWMGYESQVFPALAEAIEDNDWKRFQQHEKKMAEILDGAAWFLREI
ncbi:Vacuolar protein sorting-associated protein 70 [Linderina macrospora]|uniref:Vacuolar protein sorting-associated protein 70 n=1 Tax=Linderina macrospora TaxID=4868 RepID=A0ACC1JHM8_9FUNG|nr:Vacuolar protein sorting-associated protein 70 [Linderina macrospora]